MSVRSESRSLRRTPSESRRSDSSRSRSRSRSRASSGSYASDEREKKTTQKPNNARGQNKGGYRASSLNSRTYSTPRGGGGQNNMTRRVLSAGRVKLNDLRNKVAELSADITRLQQENKTMRGAQHRQEKRIAQYESMEKDMPTLVQRQMEETNMLREQLRRLKERSAAKEKKLRDVEEDLERSRRLLKKMKGLVDDRQLAEREELSQRLDKVATQVDEKDKTIKNLERHIENLTKNHKHEFGIEHARQRDATRHVDQLKAELDQLQFQLREKEKELGVKHIYSNRALLRPPHHLSDSIRSTPVAGQYGGARSDPDDRSHLNEGVTNSETRFDANTSKPRLAPYANGGDAMSDTKPNNARKLRNVDQRRRVADTNRRNTEEDRRRLAEADDLAVRKEARREKEERERRDEEKRDEQDRREDAKRRERDEEARRQREEQAGREQEGKARRDAEERERGERERRAAAEEAARFAASEEGQAQQRQKEALLAKMRALDNGGGGGINEPVAPRAGTQPSRRDKPVTEDPMFGGYQPSFLSTTTSRHGNNNNATKKANLMDELFSSDKPAGAKADNRGASSPVMADFLFDGPNNNAASKGRVLPRRVRQPVATLNLPPGHVDDDDDFTL